MSNRAVIIGEPGDGARARGMLRGMVPLLILVLAMGILVGLLLPRSWGGVGIVWVLLLGILLGAGYYLSTLRQQLMAYFKGARGEEVTAIRLGMLPSEWVVLHNVERLGADHIVVGPAGLFVIETKNWNGVVTAKNDLIEVDGFAPSRNPLAQVEAVVSALERELAQAVKVHGLPPVKVTPLVCFASDTLQGEAPHCVNGSELVDYLLRLPTRLSEVQVQLIADWFKR